MSTTHSIKVGPVRPAFKGDWNSGLEYQYLNIVRHNAQVWMMVGHNYAIGDEPVPEAETHGTGSETTSHSGRWVLIGQRGAKGDKGERGQDGISIKGPKGIQGPRGAFPLHKWEYLTDENGNIVYDSNGEPVRTGRIAFQTGAFDTDTGDYAYEDWVDIKGDIGPTGPSGDLVGYTGPKGDTGEQGITPEIKVGTVTPGSSTTDASVKASLQNGAYVLDFVLPRGVQGAQATTSVEKADALSGSPTIALSGGAVGTPTVFNGSKNITIPVTSIDASKVLGTANISTTGNAKTATTASALHGSATLTSDLNFKNASSGSTFSVVKFKNPSSSGAVMLVDGGAQTILGNSGSAQTYFDGAGSSTAYKDTVVTASSWVYFQTNLSSGYSNRKTFYCDGSGNMTIPGTLYANAVNGTISGTAGTASTCTGNAATATRLATARNITVNATINGKTATSTASFNGTGNVALNLNLSGIANCSNCSNCSSDCSQCTYDCDCSDDYGSNDCW